MRLRLPAVLTVAILGTAAAVTACGGHDEYYCAEPDPVDAGVAGQPDAAPCGQTVYHPEDCPPGCIPESFG